MAPKRGRNKVTQVVKTTKVVEEMVEVSFLGTQSQEEVDLAQTQVQTPTREVSERREEQTTVTTKTIPIETETETQEPEVPLDEPMFDKIATPPREEARPRLEVEPMGQDDQPNKRGKNSKEEGEAQPQAQKEAQLGKKGRRKGRRMKEVGEGREGYKSYVFKVLKQVHPGMTVSGKAMTVINNLMSDMFERLASEAARLNTHAKRQTLSAREIQAAVKLVLPGELGKHAIAEGTKAVTNYMNYDNDRK